MTSHENAILVKLVSDARDVIIEKKTDEEKTLSAADV